MTTYKPGDRVRITADIGNYRKGDEITIDGETSIAVYIDLPDNMRTYFIKTIIEPVTTLDKKDELKRRPIEPGKTYGRIVTSNHACQPDTIGVHIIRPHSGLTASELREAAHTFNQLAEALERPALPVGVCYSTGHFNGFYDIRSGDKMSEEFQHKWISRAAEFPPPPPTGPIMSDKEWLEHRHQTFEPLGPDYYVFQGVSGVNYSPEAQPVHIVNVEGNTATTYGECEPTLFDCPHWPNCGCPDGVVACHCPNLKENK